MVRIPLPAVRDWIFRTLQSAINLCEVVLLGLPILDREHTLALEHQTSRLLWLVNEIRYRRGEPRIDKPRSEYQIRLDGDLVDDEDLPYSVTIAYPSEQHMERWFDE